MDLGGGGGRPWRGAKGSGATLAGSGFGADLCLPVRMDEAGSQRWREGDLQTGLLDRR
jgi:hypothetical protein